MEHLNKYAKEELDTDRVNFLIWRYLVESNYRETAVKLQKEWDVEAPLRQMDFASRIGEKALVNIINRGLRYTLLTIEHAFVSEASVAVQEFENEERPLGFFGPLKLRPPEPDVVPEEPEGKGDDDAEAEPDVEVMPPQALVPAPALPAPPTVSPGPDMENTRKRQADKQQPSIVNGSPAKRPRLSNGYENGVDSATTPMELDNQDRQDHQGDNNHAYPSPLEGEQALSPVLRTDGPQQGTQVDKVEELASETTFMPLGPRFDDATALSRVNSDNAPVLLHCQWHPRDPSLLAAAGTDALARIWNISRGPADLESDNHVTPSVPDFHDLIDDDTPKGTVTAMAWNLEGTAIAVATDADSKARLTLWTPEGSHIHHFEVAEPPIIKLRWNYKSTAILAVAPDNGGTMITIYHALTLNSSTYYLPNHDLNTEPVDAAWTTDSDFLLCGGELLVLLRYSNNEISEVQKLATREGDTLTQVKYDQVCCLAATCGEKGVIDVWNNSGDRRSIEAHGDAVTALAWQPAASPAIPMMEKERLLASGGEDGIVSIWNAYDTDLTALCSMTMGAPIVALAFTPDGAFIAGATSERVLIWKVGDYGVPRASWSRLSHPGELSPRLNSESDDEDEYCLCWDATGHKLAYGASNCLAVINFHS